MRILFVTYWKLPHVGGVNTYLNVLKKKLEEYGHYIDIVAHHPDMTKIYMINTDHVVQKPKIKAVVNDRIDNYCRNYLSNVHPWILEWELERYTFELAASLFDLDHYDLIHTHDTISTRALWRVKPKHVPLVATIHSLIANEYIYGGNITNKETLLWKYVAAAEFYGAVSSDHTIVPTKWLQQELSRNFSVPESKLTVIPYGMDLVSFLEQMKEEPYPPVEKNPKQFVIACLARLVPVKNHKTLIEALRIVKETRKDFVCWFIGDGHLRNDLESYCKEQGVADHVVLMGNRKDIPALFNKSDFIVLPSIEDNQPYVIMEAQVAGKAIVASDAGGIPEMIRHRETGLIFENRNSLQLAHRLVEIMSNPELRQQLETNAKAWGEQQWSSKLLYEHTINIYNQVLERVRSSNGTEPNLEGQYGLRRDKVIQEDAVWEGIVGNLPTTYSIPDPSFIKILTS